MICVVATIETAAGRRNDLLNVFQGLVSKVRAEKGCIEYVPMVDSPNDLTAARSDVVTVVEKWESLAALQAHLKTPHMDDFRKQTEPLRLKLTLQILQPA